MSYKNKIEAYLKSGRRGKAANQLERDAMDDLFLNDALEGYANTDNTHIITNIDKLEKILEQRVEKRPNKTFIRWIAASAAVLLVFITGYQFLNTNDNPPEPKSQLAVSSNYTAEKQEAYDELAATQDNEEVFEKALEQNTTIQQDKQPEKITVDNSKQVEKRAATDLSANRQNAEVQMEESILLGDYINELTAKKTDAYIKPMDNKQLFVRIDTAISSIIDNAPKVAEVPSTLGKLQGTSVTRQSGAIIDGPDGFNKFIDKEQQLENAISTGYSTKKQKSALASSANSHMFDIQAPAITPGSFSLVNINVKELEPVTGMDNYKQYLKEQLKYPADAVEQKKEGRVVLSFLINNEGRPYAIKVERTLTQSCDKEAIRLLNEGASWNPSSGNSQKRIKLKIEFRLNK